jgi:hypothetical protein
MPRIITAEEAVRLGTLAYMVRREHDIVWMTNVPAYGAALA